MIPAELPDSCRLLIRLTNDAVLILNDNVVVDSNRWATGLSGRPAAELKGLALEDLPLGSARNPGLLRDLSAVGLENMLACEAVWTHESGARIPCLLKAAGMPTAAGRLLILTVRDISGHLDLQRQLGSRTAQLQAVLNSLPFDFWMNDTENRTIMQNDFSKNLWGETSGKRMEEITDQEEIKTQWRVSNEMALRGQVFEGEQSYTIGGGKRTFRNIVGPILEDGQVTGILGLNIDISDYKNTQERLTQALRERETLIKEVHHRVKNNLQLIISLLNLQRSHMGGAETGIIDDIEGRISAMALIHEQLYTSKSLDRIDMPRYLEQMTDSIRDMYDLFKRKITINLRAEACTLTIEKAIPVGIIINELVTNSVKHAFVGQASGTIGVDLSAENDSTEYRLRVHDDGVGTAAGADRLYFRLGLTLVEQLSMQLRGRLTVESAPGKGFSGAVVFTRDVFRD